MELVNAYVKELQVSTRACVQENVRKVRSQERDNIVRVRQVVLAEGKSQSACIAEQKAALFKYMLTEQLGPAQTQQAPGHTVLLINALVSGASLFLPAPFTPTRPLSTATIVYAPAPQAWKPSYRPDFDPLSVLLAVAHPACILYVKYTTLSDTLKE